MVQKKNTLSIVSALSSGRLVRFRKRSKSQVKSGALVGEAAHSDACTAL